MARILSEVAETEEQEYHFEWDSRMRGTDYGLIAFTAVHHMLMLGVVAHLVWCRDWPPYVTKNVTLVSACNVRLRLPRAAEPR